MTIYEDELASPFAAELFEGPRPGAPARPAAQSSAAITAIEGTKQGKLAGDNGAVGGRIRVTKLSYTVVAPRDLATGQASGKRTHKPLVFRCEPGAFAPQLFQALVTNEVLKGVKFELSRADRAGQQSVYLTIELQGATVSGWQAIHENGDTTALEVALTFQHIELKAGSRVATDNWSTGL